MSVISVSEHLAALVNVEIQARDKERERIIKLLEDPKTMNGWIANWDRNLGVYGNVAGYLAALIKEENK